MEGLVARLIELVHCAGFAKTLGKFGCGFSRLARLRE